MTATRPIRGICLSLIFVTLTATGQISWLFRSSDENRFRKDSNRTITTNIRASARELKKQAENEHAPAIQFGKIHSTVNTSVNDDHWYGDLNLDMSVRYTATYGVPFDLVERGLRIEKDASSDAIYAIVALPAPLLVAVDTASIRITNRRRSWLRTWGRQSDLQVEATRRLTALAQRDAQRKCSQDGEWLALARKTVHGIVVDGFGLAYNQSVKRDVARRLVVVFEHELQNQNILVGKQNPERSARAR